MFEKKAPTQAPIHDLLARRWSARAYDPERDVDEEQLRSLLEAARWAPSCYGAQPWHMLVCRRAAHPEAWEQTRLCLSEGNRVWAGHAPLFLVITANRLFAHNQEPNRWAQYDTGAAAENICLQATSMDLITHQMGGFDATALAQGLGIPDTYVPMAVLAVGYQRGLDDIPAELREREQAPRQRNDWEENFSAGKWGEPYRG